MGRAAVVVHSFYDLHRGVVLVTSILGLVEIVLFMLVTFVSVDANYEAHIALVSSAFAVGYASETVLLWRRWRDVEIEKWMFGLNCAALVALLILIIIFLVIELATTNEDSGIVEYFLFVTLIYLTIFLVLDLPHLHTKRSKDIEREMKKHDDDLIRKYIELNPDTSKTAPLNSQVRKRDV